MSEDAVEYEFCSNCKRDIISGNFFMHQMHCQRNLALCMKCDEPIPHVDLPAHNSTFHATIDCPACGLRLEKMQLGEHQKSACNRRAICCSYCHIEAEANELADHENYCGSRTEKCEECGEFVMLKYQHLHLETNHGFLKLDEEPGPIASWNKHRATQPSLSNDLSRQRKVLNTVQDCVRPPASSNRLSPSKRTNDMPQVNSVVIPKALHKPVIQNDMDSDRLLALRLQDQERNPYAIATNLMGKLELSGEMVALPCEFCNAMIPANQLVIHETGCRPDLACFKNAIHADVTGSPNNGLPCEFCGGLYPPYNLLAHQASCEQPIRDEVLVNQLGLPAKDNNVVTKKQLNLPEASRVIPLQNMTNDPKSIGTTNPADEYRQTTLPEYPRYVGSANGFIRSTGAVPKQKAGNRVGLREIQQEISRTSSSPVVKALARNTDLQR